MFSTFVILISTIFMFTRSQLSVTHNFSYIICPAWTYSSIYYTTVMTYLVFITQKRLNCLGVSFNVKFYSINFIDLFLSSNNLCDINVSSFSQLNLWKTWVGKSACKYLIFILFILLLKFDSISLVFCNSPVMELHLYLKEMLLLQWVGNDPVFSGYSYKTDIF